MPAIEKTLIESMPVLLDVPAIVEWLVDKHFEGDKRLITADDFLSVSARVGRNNSPAEVRARFFTALPQRDGEADQDGGAGEGGHLPEPVEVDD